MTDTDIDNSTILPNMNSFSNSFSVKYSFFAQKGQQENKPCNSVSIML